MTYGTQPVDLDQEPMDDTDKKVMSGKTQKVQTQEIPVFEKQEKTDERKIVLNLDLIIKEIN